MARQSMARAGNRVAATIPNGAAVSNPIDIHDMGIIGLVLPAVWTAADLTFEHTTDDTTWSAVFDDANAEVKVAAATMAARVNDTLVPTAAILAKLEGLHTIRLRSGVKGTPVNQGQATTILVLLKS